MDTLSPGSPPEQGAPEPTAPVEPTAPAAPVEPAAEELPPLPPHLEEAMRATGIPDMLTVQLREEIRKSEREHQKALEAARQNAAPPEWAELVRQAQAQQLTPDVMLNAYNASVQIMQDPVGFSIRLNEQIDQLIESGQLTAREGYRMKKEAADAVADMQNDPLETPEQRELRELRESQRTLEERLEAEARARAEQEAEEDAKRYADHFMSVLDQATAGADERVTGIIANAAAGILSSDQTGKITPEAAVETAVAQARAAGITWGAPQAPQQNGAPPVGGTGGVPGPAAEKLPPANTPEGRNAREKRMLEVAAQLVSGDR